MRKIKPKVFIACDTTSILKVSKIIKETKKSSISFGYKFGLEFLNSKNGRNFLSKFKNEITFGDYKLADIPNTCASAVKSIKDGSFFFPRLGTGAKKGLSVSIRILFNGRNLNVFCSSTEFLKVIMPLAEK